MLVSVPAPHFGDRLARIPSLRTTRRRTPMTQLRVTAAIESFDINSQLPLLWASGSSSACTAPVRLRRRACGACTVRLDGARYALCITPSRRGRQGDHHYRGFEPRRHTSPPAHLGRAQRSAVRLLPARADHAGHRAAGANTRPTDAQVTDASVRRLCRCGTYQRIALPSNRSRRRCNDRYREF